MRITVCELHDDVDPTQWRRLIDHAQSERSELVLLPEMPFSPWIAAHREIDAESWDRAVTRHQRRHRRLNELELAVVVGTAPARSASGRALNRGFLRPVGGEPEKLHDKVYLPDEEGFWEASWYCRGIPEFQAGSVGGCTLGMLICTEMWFTEHVRAYARQGIHLLAAPRATGGASFDKWLAAAASSNRSIRTRTPIAGRPSAGWRISTPLFSRTSRIGTHASTDPTTVSSR